MPDDLLRALWDPTAPLPSVWPTGALGAFLLFLFPVGAGIPGGVLMARDAGVGVPVTLLLYFLSDVVLAFVTEPWIAVLRWLGRRIPPLGRIGTWLTRFTGGAGLRESGARGPLGLILVAFSISPTTGRAAAAAAGHGFVPGWSLAITGDMGYFALVMASTLWLSGLIGDDRITIGAVLIGTWVLPLVIRRLRAARQPAPAPATAAPALAEAAVAGAAPAAVAVSTPLALAGRRAESRARRRRAARRLHR
jgi:hypothetical protein